MIGSEGILPDPEKKKAIKRVKAPANIPELRQFLGMVNQVGKFMLNLAELTQPLHTPLTKSTSWVWVPDQLATFQQVKDELMKFTTLTLYNPATPTKYSSHRLFSNRLEETGDLKVMRRTP